MYSFPFYSKVVYYIHDYAARLFHLTLYVGELYTAMYRELSHIFLTDAEKFIEFN